MSNMIHSRIEFQDFKYRSKVISSTVHELRTGLSLEETTMMVEHFDDHVQSNKNYLAGISFIPHSFMLS